MVGGSKTKDTTRAGATAICYYYSNTLFSLRGCGVKDVKETGDMELRKECANKYVFGFGYNVCCVSQSLGESTQHQKKISRIFFVETANGLYIPSILRGGLLRMFLAGVEPQ